MKNATIKPFLGLVLAIFCFKTQAQIGINSPNPHSSAVMEIKSDKLYKAGGLLIPYLSQYEREQMDVMPSSVYPKPAHSLLVFDSTIHHFTYFDKRNGIDAWQMLNPWTTGTPSGGSTSGTKGAPSDEWAEIHSPANIRVGIGRVPTNFMLEVQGNSKFFGNTTATGTLTAKDYSSDPNISNCNGPIPKGGIIMWSGDTADIPDGWALCDGTDNTPDLRGRFIVGYNGSSYNYGGTGGSESVTLNTSQIPSHNHDKGDLNISGSGDHGHTTNGIVSNHKTVGKNSGGGEDAQRHDAPTASVSGSGSHSHPNSDFFGSTGYTGGTQAHENRPPYYVLAFIMKK